MTFARTYTAVAGTPYVTSYQVEPGIYAIAVPTVPVTGVESIGVATVEFMDSRNDPNPVDKLTLYPGDRIPVLISELKYIRVSAAATLATTLSLVRL